MSFSDSTAARPPVHHDGVGSIRLPDGRIRISVTSAGLTIHHDLPPNVAWAFAWDLLDVAAARERKTAAKELGAT